MIAIIVLILRILMAVTLYGFLGWTIYTLWSDLKFHSQVLSHRKIPPLTLMIDNGPLAGNHTFSQNEIIIGREDTCDISIADSIVSSRHARLIFRNAHWWIEDLMSTNGTFLNDERVESAAILINGDELRIGKNIFAVNIPMNN